MPCDNVRCENCWAAQFRGEGHREPWDHVYNPQGVTRRELRVAASEREEMRRWHDLAPDRTVPLFNPDSLGEEL